MEYAEIINKNHLVELLTRNPQLLEDGLRPLDTEIITWGNDYIDLVALDANNRLVVLGVSDEEQSSIKPKGKNILKQALFSWYWVNDLRYDFIYATEQKFGVKPQMVPPRLVVIAPSFPEPLLQLASYLAKRIALQLFTYDKKNFALKGSPFQPAPFAQDLPADERLIKELDAYYADKLEQHLVGDAKTKEKMLEPRAYIPNNFDNQLKRLKNDLKTPFSKLVGGIKDLKQDLQSYWKKDRAVFKNVYGDTVCEITFPQEGDFYITSGVNLPESIDQGQQFTPDNVETALASIRQIALSLKKFRAS